MAKKKEDQPQYYTSRINSTVLNYAVYVMRPGEKLLWRLILLALGGAVGLVFYGGLFKAGGKATVWTIASNVVVFLVFGLLANRFFMKRVLASKKKKRANVLKKQFCDFASAMTNALAGGMNVNDALRAANADLQGQYADDTYIVQEVREIISGVDNNIPIEVMIGDFGQRSGIEDITNFATVFATCFRTGGDIKSVIRRTTEILSEKVMIASEIETAITSNKLQMNIMNLLPIVLVLMMRVMSPQFAESFSSVVGIGGLTVAAGLTVVAYFLGQKIMDIKG